MVLLKREDPVCVLPHVLSYRPAMGYSMMEGLVHVVASTCMSLGLHPGSHLRCGCISTLPGKDDKAVE